MRHTKNVVLISCVLIGIMVGCLFAEEKEEQKPYEILYDEYFEVESGRYVYKIIRKGESGEDHLLGKVIVGGYSDINCFMFTADQLDEYRGGTFPEDALIEKERVGNLTISKVLDWEEEEKYYLVFSNSYSVITDKGIYLYLIRIPLVMN